MIDLVCHLMDIYEKITETDLKENHERFGEALDTTTTIGKYFEKLMNVSSMQMMSSSHTQRLRS